MTDETCLLAPRCRRRLISAQDTTASEPGGRMNQKLHWAPGLDYRNGM